MYCTPMFCRVRFAQYVAFWVVLVDDCTYFCLFVFLSLYCLSFCDWWLLLTHLISSSSTFLSDSTLQFDDFCLNLSADLVTYFRPLVKYMGVWKYGRNSKMYECMIFFLTCSPMLSVSLKFAPLQLLMAFFLLMCCLVSLFLACSPMLYVFYEFITPPFMMESVLLIVLVFSWLVEQCCLCFLSSPLPSVCLDACWLSV
jgi:hypothetical protein